MINVVLMLSFASGLSVINIMAEDDFLYSVSFFTFARNNE